MTLASALIAAGLAAVAYLLHAPAQRVAAARPRVARRLVVAALVVALLAALLVGAAYAYDASKARVIASGVDVGNVRVGGLTAQAARRKLERAYSPLRRPIVARFGARGFTLSPRGIDLVVHVDGAVSQALAESRDGSFLARTVRELVGPEIDAHIQPRVDFSRQAVGRFSRRVEQALERPPRPARVVPHAGGLAVVRGAAGLEVRGGLLRRRIERALVNPGAARLLFVPAQRIPPRVTPAVLRRRYASYITVDRTRFRLRLYEHLKLVRTYTIAVGQIGYDTPAGLYRIRNKAVDPSWTVPDSTWTGALAGAVIPPGPANPLKARWLGIYGGVGIHGTDQTWSLGTAASHGCLRMAIPDVIELYDRVEVGTPIYIA
jgi:lipoprotein-anchoring transpeptidase ErfK/SrfK